MGRNAAGMNNAKCHKNVYKLARETPTVIILLFILMKTITGAVPIKDAQNIVSFAKGIKKMGISVILIQNARAEIVGILNVT